MEKENSVKKKKKSKISLGIKRVLLLLMSIGVIGMSVGMFLLYGPIKWFRNTLITTAMTTKSHQYLARWFFSEEYINKVLANNFVVEVNEDTNPNLINMGGISSKYSNKYEKDLFQGVTKDTIYKKIYVKGKGYDGYIIAVYKPEKVKMGVSSKLGTSGETVKVIAENNNALVAMNGGGFYDPTWNGNGAIAHGTLIKDSKIIWDYKDANVGGGFIGFNQENVLVLGRMNANQAMEKGMRDAMEFGPFLIVNGKASFVKGDGGWGIAPRSAIGQREDGVVLFVVINGRNYKAGIPGIDLVGMTELMQNYGCVNAANLDGGTSSALVEKQKNGEMKLINNPISSTGAQGVMRRIPTAWIVVE